MYIGYRDLISGRFGLPLCAKDPFTFSSPFSRLRVGIPFGLPLGTGSSLLRLHSNGEHLRHPESQGYDSSPSSPISLPQFCVCLEHMLGSASSGGPWPISACDNLSVFLKVPDLAQFSDYDSGQHFAEGHDLGSLSIGHAW